MPSKPQGYIYLPEFAHLLGKKEAQTVKIIKSALKKGVIPANARFEKEMNEKGRPHFSYNKSAIGAIKDDWGKSNGKLVKPRNTESTVGHASTKEVTRLSKASAKSGLTIKVPVPSQEMYDLLLKGFGSEADIAAFLLAALKGVYNRLQEVSSAKLKEVEDDMKRETKAILKQRFSKP